MAKMAVVHDPHVYQPDKSYRCNHLNHPDHDHSKKASDATHHAPCKVCGAAEGSYVHTDEAADAGFTLVQVLEEQHDTASASEHHTL